MRDEIILFPFNFNHICRVNQVLPIVFSYIFTRTRKFSMAKIRIYTFRGPTSWLHYGDSEWTPATILLVVIILIVIGILLSLMVYCFFYICGNNGNIYYVYIHPSNLLKICFKPRQKGSTSRPPLLDKYTFKPSRKRRFVPIHRWSHCC